MGLIHEPSLMFLDEPTTGLDPQARANLWEHISELRTRRGATVFLTTHYLDEADTLSDRIIIIDRGRIVASDTAENLKAQVAGDLVDLEIADLDMVPLVRDKLGTIAEAPRHGLAVWGGGRPSCPWSGPACRARDPGLLRDLDRTDVTLASIEVHRPTLDDVFLTLTVVLRDADTAASDTATGDPDPSPPPPPR